MRFIVDECTGSRVAEWLRSLGHDVFSVFDDARGTTDDAVLALSLGESRILVTNDKDFGDKICRDGQSHVGVVLLRVDGGASDKIAALERLFRLNMQLELGFVVVTTAGIRFGSAPTA